MQQQKKYPRLSKAPIILAILEIKFVPPEKLKILDLKSLKGTFKDAYPNQADLSNTQIQFTAGGDKTPISIKNSGVSGFTFGSKDKKRDFHLTIDSFNFKQHSPYDTWDSFKTVALQAWQQCYEKIRPVALSRISIRYINHIDVPVPGDAEMTQGQFFRTFIAHTGTLTKGRPISNYFIRYTHPPGEDSIAIHFAQELKMGEPNKFPFIVDIDVLYDKTNIPSDFSFINEKLDELRHIKNEYFFENLTEYTYNLIK